MKFTGFVGLIIAAILAWALSRAKKYLKRKLRQIALVNEKADCG